MVMVFNTREAVPGSSVKEVQPAYDTDFHQELDGPEDSRPSHSWQLIAYLLGGEALQLPFQNPDDGASRGCGAVAPVFKDGHDVRVRGERSRHGT